MGIDLDSGEWTPDLSKLNSEDRTVQLTELRQTLAERLLHADARETVALSRELDRVSVMLAAIKGDEGDEVERARQGYAAAAGGAGTPRRHLSAVRDDSGAGGM
jgi:hypothetical protein